MLRNKCTVPKESYIGAPVKHIVHTCHVCGKTGPNCTCGHYNDHCGTNGTCAVVVDDFNGVVYLYGDNIMHENHHVPGNNCVAYTTVANAGFEFRSLMAGDEFFEGQQDQNTVTIAHEPQKDNTFMVFLNGVKQREGEEQDFVRNGRDIHFNFYELLETDLVEVMYTYGTEA